MNERSWETYKSINSETIASCYLRGLVQKQNVRNKILSAPRSELQRATVK